MTLNRRNLIKAYLAGAAFGIVGLGQKSGRADVPPRAKRLLIFNAAGGIRNTAAFNASSQTTQNPWGVLGTYGVLKLGNVLVASPGVVSFDAPSWGGLAPNGKIPGIEQVAKNFSILGAVNHDTVGFRAGDHTDEVPRMGTGYYGSGAPGAVTVMWRALSPSNPPLPAVSIGYYGWAGGAFGYASGEWLQYAPVAVDSFQLPVGATLAPKPTYALEDAIDGKLRAGIDGRAGGMVDGYLGLKAALRAYGPVLTQPTLHLNDSANLGASVGGITNQMLLEAIGNIVTPTAVGDPEGVSVALALRMLQMGSPVAMVGLGGFDRHSQEMELGPDLYTRYARMLAGIYFALSNIQDPAGGGSMLGSTLVVTTSEFDRAVNAGSSPSGFNAGDGSDHANAGGDANPHQPHVVFGAGITPKALVPTDDANQPTSGQHSTHALLATLCAAVGTPQASIDEVWPPGSPLYPEAKPIMDLWG
jgi:hypothetical protein